MGKYIGVSALVAVLATPLLSMAQTVSTRASLYEGTAAKRPARDTAVAFLSKRVESVDWDEKPFEEVVDWLEDESEDLVNILPRWNALSAESVDRDAFVTLKLRNTNVGEVLLETLQALSEDDALAFRATGNKLKISTKTDFDRNLVLRVYDVTDIIFRVPDMGQGAPRIDLQQQQGGGGGGGGGQSVFGGGGGGGGQEQGGRQAEQEAEQRLEELVNKLKLVIAPDTWIGGANATAVGNITSHNMSLIVINTLEVHEQIGGLFHQE